jgi:hypothetical protein
MCTCIFASGAQHYSALFSTKETRGIGKPPESASGGWIIDQIIFGVAQILFLFG